MHSASWNRATLTPAMRAGHYAHRVSTPPLALPASGFSIAFGLAGLSGVWRLAHQFLGAPAGIATALTVLTLVVWAVLLVLYVRRIARGHTSVREEIHHPVTAPFLALIPVTLIVLVPELSGWARGPATVVAWAAMLVALALGAWLTGQWVGHGVPETAVSSGYYLPTVAAGLLSATALASLSENDLGLMAFGLGGICWLIVGSIINNRNFVVTSLPPAMQPTMAIDVAPVVVAGSAWFALNGGRPDAIQLGLAGFAVLMVGVQIRLISVYRRLTFSASFWAFTFSYCAVISYGLRWLATAPGSWPTVASWALVALITLFVGTIAVRSVAALRAGTFLPREPVPAAAP